METPPYGTVDGGEDAVLQRLNRRKGINEIGMWTACIFTTWTAAARRRSSLIIINN
jgi:hypothetical protein